MEQRMAICLLLDTIKGNSTSRLLLWEGMGNCDRIYLISLVLWFICHLIWYSYHGWFNGMVILFIYWFIWYLCQTQCNVMVFWIKILFSATSQSLHMAWQLHKIAANTDNMCLNYGNTIVVLNYEIINDEWRDSFVIACIPYTSQWKKNLKAASLMNSRVVPLQSGNSSNFTINFSITSKFSKIWYYNFCAYLWSLTVFSWRLCLWVYAYVPKLHYDYCNFHQYISFPYLVVVCMNIHFLRKYLTYFTMIKTDYEIYFIIHGILQDFHFEIADTNIAHLILRLCNGP